MFAKIFIVLFGIWTDMRIDMNSQDAISQAKKAASENDFAAAQQILKKVLTNDPKNIEAWLFLAEVVEKPEIKVKCLERVLKIDPGNDDARQRLFYAMQDVSELEKFNETIAPEPQSLIDRLQSVSTPSSELNDPWQVEQRPQAIPVSKTAAAASKKPEQQLRQLQKQTKKKGRWLEISLIGVLAMTAVCVLGLFLLIPSRTAVQGGQISKTESPAAENPLNVIIENVRASNAENANYYMSTIHSESPVYQNTKKMTQEAFSLFDLSYKVSGLKIIKETKNEVVVAFTLTTRKINGPSFRDNRITGEMILRKEDGRWKIYDQVVHDVKYLN
jgi:tetratricopeptide (TPR) repeat protein